MKTVGTARVFIGGVLVGVFTEVRYSDEADVVPYYCLPCKGYHTPPARCPKEEGPAEAEPSDAQAGSSSGSN